MRLAIKLAFKLTCDEGGGGGVNIEGFGYLYYRVIIVLVLKFLRSDPLRSSRS